MSNYHPTNQSVINNHKLIIKLVEASCSGKSDKQLVTSKLKLSTISYILKNPKIIAIVGKKRWKLLQIQRNKRTKRGANIPELLLYDSDTGSYVRRFTRTGGAWYRPKRKSETNAAIGWPALEFEAILYAMINSAGYSNISEGLKNYTNRVEVRFKLKGDSKRDFREFFQNIKHIASDFDKILLELDSKINHYSKIVPIEKQILTELINQFKILNKTIKELQSSFHDYNKNDNQLNLRELGRSFDKLMHLSKSMMINLNKLPSTSKNYTPDRDYLAGDIYSMFSELFEYDESGMIRFHSLMPRQRFIRVHWKNRGDEISWTAHVSPEGNIKYVSINKKIKMGYKENIGPTEDIINLYKSTLDKLKKEYAPLKKSPFPLFRCAPYFRMDQY